MRFPDPYALKNDTPKETVLFALHQELGTRDTQQDYFSRFIDECFVLADGVGSLPNGDVAAKLACDTAIWAYKHIRQHRYYWSDKKLFMKRIYRSTNLAVWQKHREEGFEGGLATTLLVLMVGPKHVWLGNAGDSSAWVLHEGEITKLTKENHDFEQIPANALGIVRLGLVPEFVTMPFEEEDVLLLTTAGAGDYLTSQDIQTCMTSCGDGAESMKGAVTALLAAARTNGSEDNMSAVLVKRATG
jgi:protein phosphatase